jgi:hypothetical protein
MFQMIKDVVKILHKMPQIFRHVVFIVGVDAVGKSGSNGLFRIQHGRRFGPGMFIDAEVWFAAQAAKTSGSQRLCHRTVFCKEAKGRGGIL